MAQKEVTLLLSSALICLCLWAFFAIAGEAGEPEHQPLEAKILRAMRKADDPGRIVGPVWAGEAARDLSALGGPQITTLLVVLVTCYLAARGRKREAVLVAAAVVGGVWLDEVLKQFFQRPRPTVVPHLMDAGDFSFPSGHSMNAAVVYLTLGVLLARSAGGWRARVFFVAAGLWLSGLVGVSRVMLGVHYPTDVLAGWTAGLGWALACRVVADLFWPDRAALESRDEA